MPRDPSPTTAAERYLPILFETVPLGVAVLDLEFRFVEINERFAKLNDLSRESIIGATMETVLPITGARVRAILEQIVASGEARRKIVIAGERPADNPQAPLHVEADFQPLMNDDGRVTGILAMLRDTSAEIESREEIERERARFAGAVRAVSGLAFEWDPYADTIEWSDGLERLTGYTAAELAPGAKGWIAHVVPEDLAKINDAVRHYLETGHNKPAPYRFIRKDGAIVWLSSTVEWVRDLRRSERVFGLVRDVTEAMRASQEVRDSEERFRLLANLVPDLIWTADRNGITDWLNDRWSAFAGLALPRGLENWAQLIHRDDFGALVPQWNACVQSGREFESEYRLRSRTGEYRWFLGRAKPLRDAAGAVTMWLGTATDVHDYRTALDDLRAAEEQRRLALEAGSIGAFQWTAENNRLAFSPEAQHMLGLPSANFGGAPGNWRSNIHPDDRTMVKAMTEAAVAARAPRLQMEFRIATGDAPVRWIESRGSIEYDSGGRPSRTSGVFVDITARKQQEERINLLLREMHHRVKNAFAMIAALVGLSAKSARDVREYSDALRGRVQSLAIAHALSFADSENESVGVLELIRQLLPPFILDNDSRVSVSGNARLRIAERQVSSLALAIHELATNSVKHGALKDMDGKLSILVEPTAEIGGAGIAIRWTESGVEAPAEPAAQGFGSVLIERSMQQIGAELTRRWENGSYRVDLIVPR